MSLKLAWRNIWRNGRRTAITVAAAAMSVAILIFFIGLMDGIVAQLVRDITGLVIGEVQIQAPEYAVDRSLYKTIPDPDAVLRRARELRVDAAPRAYGFGLVSHGTKSAGATFIGMDPDAERRAFRLAERVPAGQGRFLDPSVPRGIVLGSRLAHTLNASVGDEIVAVVQAADGSMGNELFAVTGILAPVTETIDRGGALIRRADFEELFAAPGMVHEIALNTRQRTDPAVLATGFNGLPGIRTRTWREVVPSIAHMLEMMNASMFIMGFVFCLAAGLGVMNTMLMATHERIRELGVQKALGASPGRILADITLEATLIGAVAAAAGALLGNASTLYFHYFSLSLSRSTSFSGIAYQYILATVPSVHGTVFSVLIMSATGVLAALYPAIRAARLDPVKAITNI